MTIPKVRHILIEKTRPAECLFLDLISCGLIAKVNLKHSGDLFLFNQTGGYMFLYIKNTNQLFCSHELVWRHFENIFSDLDSQDSYKKIRKLINNKAEKYFNLKDTSANYGSVAGVTFENCIEI